MTAQNLAMVQEWSETGDRESSQQFPSDSGGEPPLPQSSSLSSSRGRSRTMPSRLPTVNFEEDGHGDEFDDVASVGTIDQSVISYADTELSVATSTRSMLGSGKRVQLSYVVTPFLVVFVSTCLPVCCARSLPTRMYIL